MVKIMSIQGYPKDDELLVRIDYFLRSPVCEGGILFVGKDSNSQEYSQDYEGQRIGSYSLPSGACYRVAVGSDPCKNHPAVYFPFELSCSLEPVEISAKADANEDFFDSLDMKIMDKAGMHIVLDENQDLLFKFIASYAVLEIADAIIGGRVINHFWGELYLPKTPGFISLLDIQRD